MYLIPNISEFPAKSYEVEVVACHLQFSMPSSLTRMALFGLILPCFSTIHLNTITSLSLSTNTLIPPDWPPGPRGVLHQHLRQPGPQTRCRPVIPPALSCHREPSPQWLLWFPTALWCSTTTPRSSTTSPATRNLPFRACPFINV